MKKFVACFIFLMMTPTPIVSMRSPVPKDHQTWYEYFKMKRDQFWSFFKKENTVQKDGETVGLIDEYESRHEKPAQQLIKIDQRIIRESKILDRPYIAIDNENEEKVITYTINTLDTLITNRAALITKYPTLVGQLSAGQIDDLSARITGIKRRLTDENNLRYKTGIPAEFTSYIVEDRRPPLVPEEPADYPIDYKK